MSYISQSIRNRFPEWSAIRKDDSSNGAKIIDSFGEVLENFRNDVKKINIQKPSLEYEPVYELGNIYYSALTDEESYVNYYRENKYLDSIEISANTGNETIPLIKYETYNELVQSLPNRIKSEYIKLKNSLIKETNENEISESFYLDKDGENIYIDTNDVTNFITSVSKPFFDNDASITLRGKNSLFEDIEEKIIISNTGMYKSKNRFTSLEKIEKQEDISGGNSISIIGLEGNIRFYTSPKKIYGKEIKDKILINKINRLSNENGLIDNSLFIELRKESGSFYFDYIYRYYLNGQDYKKEESLVGSEFYEDLLFSQILLDIDSNPIIVEDFWWDKVCKKIIVIDNKGIIYYFNLKKNEFLDFKFERSKNITFSFEVLNQQVALNEEAEVFVFLERPKGAVKKYFIVLEKPSDDSDDYSQLLFLNENKEFVEEISFLKGKDHLDIFENVDSFSFTNTYDEIGQYDYYIISFTEKDDILESLEDGQLDKNNFFKRIKKRIEDPLERIIHVNRTSVFCEYLKPEKTLDTSLGEGNYSIYKEGCEYNLYCLKDNLNEEELYKIKEYKDGFIFNYRSGEIGTTDNYSTLSININNSLVIEASYD